MKFYIHKLGCPKNDVDADYIAARLTAAGHSPVASPDEADSVIVNTCGFILPAKEESIDEIIRLGEIKKHGGFATLYASGCLSQRYGDKLLRGMAELDGAFGLGTLNELAEAVTAQSRMRRAVVTEARKLAYLDWPARHIADDLPFAYLKISDGCNRHCSYCAIPAIRGSYRSRPLDSVLGEAEFLAAHGKKELILVSQEATWYGRDLGARVNILDLLRELDRINGVKWIRLLYLYPTEVSSELIDWLGADDNKTLNYFDLPLQHVNSDILNLMHRPTDRPAIEGLIRRIRSCSPDAALRTTFIVGFPGETEEHFDELLGFVADTGFDRLGAFAYSPEDGTPAEKRAGQVPETVRADRLDRLMSLQREISLAKNNSLIGKLKEVMIDSSDGGGTAVGRTRADCPDIDQTVHVSGGRVSRGDLVMVRIKAAEEYDLKGTVAGD
jgi:ribosomal protein S12 methylthiotransferase